MPLSSTYITCRIRIIILLQTLLLWPSTFAFTLLPINTRVTTARSLGVPFDIDSVIDTALTTTTILVSAAKVTAASVVTASSTAAVSSTATASSAVNNFVAGSAILFGVVAAFKWNTSENSNQIREYWEKAVESSEPPVRSVLESSTTPIKVATPARVATPAIAATTAGQSVPTTTGSSMPSAKDASSPQDLIDMMKNVGDSTTPKKKRFVVRLLKKVVMPWRKWSNL